jgi:glucoamylase
MPRDLPIGNGSLLVNFDQYYRMRDLYWPHVGQENHSTGHAFRFGVWVDGNFRWIEDGTWKRTLQYIDGTLVTDVKLENAELALALTCHDIVDFHENLYLKNVAVFNKADRKREIRLFFAHDFHISGTEVGDTAYYEPQRRAVFHYKGKRWFLINAAKKTVDSEWVIGVDQWAAGIKEAQGKEGTWRDAEDGMLSGNAVAQGSVDSVVAIHLAIEPRQEAECWYWIAVGEDFKEVIRINRAVREKTPPAFFDRTSNYWRLWAQNEDNALPKTASSLKSLYKQSLLILRTHMDNCGAVIAATDFDITHYWRDTYCYMWPRDGALVIAALIDAGYSEVARRFFEFCHRVVTEEGYFLHKYNPDESLASSWHGWYNEGQKQIPIQEDETALVLWVLWRHYQRFHNVEFIKPLFRGLIVRAANWLVGYRDQKDGLPLPSWDLWEERRGILSWTVGATWAGLTAAANFARAFGEKELALNYQHAAEEIRASAVTHLWADKLGRFVRMINRRPDGGWDIDEAFDASIVGLWYFGMIPPDDPGIMATMTALQDRLWVKTDVGGMARYENDRYNRAVENSANIPGNPWFICTLWLAQWLIAKAKSKRDLAPALKILEWAKKHSLLSGIMAEEVHPHNGIPLSVSPLTWSHGTFVMAVNEFTARFAQLEL